MGCEEIRLTENPLQVDTFEQTATPMVDILWIVDNSQSMEWEQQELGNKFEKFMNRLASSGVDYHIGIISTDTDDPAHSGRLQGASTLVITNQAQNPQELFAANVRLPQTNARNERGLDAMRLSLSQELRMGANAGFLREQAALFVILVSDEDDQSLFTPRYYARWLKQQKGPGNENLVSFSAIVGPKPQGCQSAFAGVRYQEVQSLTGGYLHSICETDYGPIVDELGVGAVGLRRKFYLSEVPRPKTLQVLIQSATAVSCDENLKCPDGLACASSRRCAQKITSVEEGGSFQYREEENALFFPEGYIPPAGSIVYAAYLRRAI